MLLSARLKGKALEWFHSQPENLESSLEDLLKEMKVMFDHKPRKLALRKLFEGHYWKHGENFSEYVHDKVIMGNRVPVDKEEIIDYIIDGIPDALLKNQARMQSFESVAELLKAFEKVTIRPKGPNGNYGGSYTSRGVPKSLAVTPQELKGQKPPSSEEGRSRRGIIRCYNCQEAGHLGRDCTRPKKRFVCFRCNEEGHLWRNCPKNQQDSQITHVGEMPIPEEDFRQRVEYQLLHDGERFSFKLDTLFDTGSPISFVKEKFILNNAVNK